MSNSINWTSGASSTILGKAPIVLPPKTLDTGSTSLSLTGRGVFNYGEFQQENFLRLLENFASPSIPTSPTVGQLWFKTSENTLYVCVDVTTLPQSSPGVYTTIIPYFVNGSYGWIKAGSSAAIGDISAALGYIPAPPLSITSGSTSVLVAATTGTQTTLTIHKSSATQDGYLAASDWAMFNAKLDAGGGTMSAPLILYADPTVNLEAATKHYVDTSSASVLATAEAYADTVGTNVKVNVSVNDASATWYDVVGTTQTSGSITQALVSSQFKFQPSTGYLHSTNLDTGTITASQILLGNGSYAAPSITFSSDSGHNTGFCWGGEGYINFASNGAYAGQIQPGGNLTVPGTISSPVGAFSSSLTAPTQGTGDSSANVATTAFVHNLVSASAGAPAISGTYGALGNWTFIAGQIPPGGIWVYYQMDIADDGNVVDARGGAGIATGGTVLNYNGAGGGQGGHYGFAWRIA